MTSHVGSQMIHRSSSKAARTRDACVRMEALQRGLSSPDFLKASRRIIGFRAGPRPRPVAIRKIGDLPDRALKKLLSRTARFSAWKLPTRSPGAGGLAETWPIRQWCSRPLRACLIQTTLQNPGIRSAQRAVGPEGSTIRHRLRWKQSSRSHQPRKAAETAQTHLRT